MSKFTRRGFLRQASLAGAAAMLPGGIAAWPFGEQGKESRLAGASAGGRKSVVVAGAGLAGLVAGYELGQAGYQVTILEGQLRPGGRVLTLRAPFSDGLFAEAGADRIPNTHELTIRYVRQFGLKLRPFLPANGRYLTQIAGQRTAGTLGPAAVWPEASASAEGLWRRYAMEVARGLGNPADAGWSPAKFAPYDSVSFTRFLRQRGASPGAIRAMTLGRDYDGVSALRVLAELAANGDVTTMYKIEGGSDLLPRALAERLAPQIRYGASLRLVEQDKRGVRASFLQGNLTHRVEADRLICTIPLPALRRVQFEPPVSDERQNQIDNAYYLSETRVFFQEHKRFWAAAGLSGFALSDWPVDVRQPTFDEPGERGILAACLTGELARRVAGLPEDRRIQSVLNEMETLYSGARVNFEGGTTKSWDEDFFAGGAYQWLRPGQMIEFWPQMTAPDGRIHFAGEHTSPWPGWMQGAIHSGLRAAREVQEASSG